MAKNNNSKQINVGRDYEGNLIQGDRNTIIQNEIDSEEISHGLQEVSKAIYNVSRNTRQEKEPVKEEAREVLETIFVSVVCGIVISTFWKTVYPWNTITVPFFVIITVLLLSILKITHFGLRHTITLTFLLVLDYVLFVNYSPLVRAWIDINQIVGIAVLGTLGAIIGFMTGIILLFWKPLGD